MVLQTQAAADEPVTITLYDDQERIESQITVTPALAALFAYADAWAREEDRDDPATLTFSSTLAAMVAGDHALCGWLRLHLALRGSAADEATKGRTFDNLPVPTRRLTTTGSFRRAHAQAKTLAGVQTLDVRHLMAAYPVVKAYHAGDFLRLRIDRRAWCLALAEQLQRAEPSEARTWRDYERLAPEVLLPRYRPDLPAGTDLLGVGREVEAFAMLIAAPRTAMPLSIGVFGAWGSGKSYFMARVEERVAALRAVGVAGGPYLQNIAQVRFNAWHYSEGDVVASLVDQIFRNLRFGPAETSAMLAERRAKVVAQVAARDREAQGLQAQADAAAAEEARLREEWQRVSAEHDATVQRSADALSSAQAAVGEAQQQLDAALAAQAQAIDAAQRVAPAETAALLVRDTIMADPTLQRLETDLGRAAENAQWVGANWQLITWGVLVVVLTAIAMAAIPVLRDSALVTTLTAAIAAATPFAAKAMALLRDLSKKGAAFQAAVHDRTQAAVAKVQAEWADQLQARQTAVVAARATVDRLRTQVETLAATARQAQTALSAGEERRRQAAEQLAQATTAAAAARRQLDALTVGSLLGDTIQEAGDTEIFRKQLGTLSYARSYFQRLSETMQAARQEHAVTTGAAPALERVVLYIDDLDRCPAPKVREVLQTVHLLLAFDLFACVVAVDPRWIIQCLEKSPGLVDAGTIRDAELDVLGGRTTPSDYLEKIFQIPLWLRPVPADRRAALAATLLARDLDPVVRTAGAKERVGELTSDTVQVDDAPTAPVVVTEVRIKPAELVFLQTRVAPLLAGNSRALKRFVNTYHLVKASLSEVEFAAFAKDRAGDLVTDSEGSRGAKRHEPYRICMAQLALLATQRRRARVLAHLVEQASADPPATLDVWLGGLDRTQDASGDAITNKASKDSNEEKEPPAAEVRAISADLRSALLPELEELPFDRFVFWFERTRRYSFYL